MSKVANTECVDIKDNKGGVGAFNKVSVQGKYQSDLTFNVALSAL